MKKIIRTLWKSLFVASFVVSAGGLLSGCGTIKAPGKTLYDLGPLPPAYAVPGLRPISVADIDAPSWLDRPEMFYRLGYDNNQQTRPYSESNWTISPVQLFQQRLKSRIAQAGGMVLSPGDGSSISLTLHLDADDFSQIFEQAGHNTGHIVMRVSVIDGRTPVAQRTFEATANAPTANAAGGVKALATASDAVIDNILQWLASLPPRK